jgi:DUF1680 family protein
MMNANEGPVINLYAPGTASFILPDRKKVTIVQDTDYPQGGLINLHILLEKTSSFVLKLRIPECSKKTILKVNGEEISCNPGSYASITREWKKNDRESKDI